jgi:hypothetical protein
MEQNEKLYHEIREKVALAFEVQVQRFLPDTELHSVVTQIYPQLYPYKTKDPNLDFEVKVVELEDHSFYARVIMKCDHLVENIEYDFIDSLKLHLNELLNKFLLENPKLDIEDCLFIIRKNKKSISISVKDDKLHE